MDPKTQHQIRSGRYLSRRDRDRQMSAKLSQLLKPVIVAEQSLMKLVNSVKGLALVGVLDVVSKLTVVVALATYLAQEAERRETKVNQAWQVVTAARSQRGNAGRIEALQFLNAEPRHFPLFWMRWPRQQLVELEVPNANLRGIDLQDAILAKANFENAYLAKANLQGAFLEIANLRGAVLGRANLQETILIRAQLQDAVLEGANLQSANLAGANLQGAYLLGADLQNAYLGGANFSTAVLLTKDDEFPNLRNAKYTDVTSTKAVCEQVGLAYPCPTHLPPGFQPQAAGMIFLRDPQ